MKNTKTAAAARKSTARRAPRSAVAESLALDGARAFSSAACPLTGLWAPAVPEATDADRARARDVVRLADWRIQGAAQDALRQQLDAEIAASADPGAVAWMTRRAIAEVALTQSAERAGALAAADLAVADELAQRRAERGASRRGAVYFLAGLAAAVTLAACAVL